MSNEQIYFDNAATTRPFDEVIDVVSKMNEVYFGNPSSLHTVGIESEKKVKQARHIVSQSLGVMEDEIVFVSGGTEGNNMMIQGAANAYQRDGKHIICSQVEHPSVVDTIKFLETKGFTVTMVDVDTNGLLDLEALENAIQPDTILVSVMQVNNETGTMQDIEQIGKIIKGKNQKTIFHVDGVQGFGKHKLVLKNVDLYTMSGHKIHGVKGTGACYIKKGTKLTPLFWGGTQEQSMRPGTENTAGIAGFGCAVQNCYANLDKHLEHVRMLKSRMIEGFQEIENVYINGIADVHSPFASPYVLNASFIGVKAEILLNALKEKGIFVSTGTTCHSKKKQHNILSHYRLSEQRVDSAIRFSFSHDNTLEEVESCLLTLKQQVVFLRKFAPR